MRKALSLKSLAPVLLLAASLPGFAQAAREAGALTVSGYPGSAPLIQMDGKSYVEMQTLARLVDGSISFQANRMTLTIPSPGPQTEPAKTGFTPEFLRAAIEEMAAIREWRIAIIEAVQHGYPLSTDWVDGYRRAADAKLALAPVSASTDADRSAIPLVNGAFAKMQQFTGKYLDLSKNMTYTSPDAVQNDPLGQQVLNCAVGVESFPAGGKFEDVLACH